MHAIIIRQQKFWGEEQRSDFMKQFMAYGHGSGFVGASQAGNTVNMFYYEEVDPKDLDDLFEAQMVAKDAFIAMPGSGKTSKNDLLGKRSVLASNLPPEYEDEDY